MFEKQKQTNKQTKFLLILVLALSGIAQKGDFDLQNPVSNHT